MNIVRDNKLNERGVTMAKTLIIKVDLIEDYNYSDLEQILENCSIVKDVELVEVYEN